MPPFVRRLGVRALSYSSAGAAASAIRAESRTLPKRRRGLGLRNRHHLMLTAFAIGYPQQTKSRIQRNVVLAACGLGAGGANFLPWLLSGAGRRPDSRQAYGRDGDGALTRGPQQFHVTGRCCPERSSSCNHCALEQGLHAQRNHQTQVVCSHFTALSETQLSPAAASPKLQPLAATTLLFGQLVPLTPPSHFR